MLCKYLRLRKCNFNSKRVANTQSENENALTLETLRSRSTDENAMHLIFGSVFVPLRGTLSSRIGVERKVLR